MSGTLLLVAAPPACGKNYVSEMIGNAASGVAYLDKDDLSVLLRRAFAVCGEDINMDGAFYLENLRPYEYETLLNLAFSALRFSDTVLVNAPFLREVRDEAYMRRLKERANALGAKLVLVWVSTPLAVCYERMKARNSDRDREKLLHWDEYVRKTDYSIPTALEQNAAVDRLIVFENANDETAQASLARVLQCIGE